MQIGSGVNSSALAQVREGMRVHDAAGTEIGKVEYVQMGDPDAVTTTVNEPAPTALFEKIAESITFDGSEPDVPDPLRTQLRRTGYLKISGHGLKGADCYVSSERVGGVSGDVVRLSARHR